MKILYIANARIPTEKAHGIQIMNMCSAFAKSSKELTLIVPKRKNPIDQDPFDYYGLEPDFKIQKISCLDLIQYSFTGKIGAFIQALTFAFNSRKHTQGVDLIYTRSYLVSAFSRTPVILELHRAKLNFLVKIAIRKARGVIVISQGLKDFYKLHSLSKNMVVLPDAVDLEKFGVLKQNQDSLRSKLGLPRGNFILMYTGHLYKGRGIDLLIQTANNFPKISVVIIGGTDKDLRQYSSQGNLFFLGRKPHQSISEYLQAADLLALTYTPENKNLIKYMSPLKLFEYMATGIGIIASDLPALREVLSEKSAAFFKAGDYFSFQKNLKILMNDKDRREKLGKRARDDVKAYSWDKRVQKIYEFLK